MENLNAVSRRVAIKSSVFGTLAVSMPNVLFAKSMFYEGADQVPEENAKRYPAIAESVVAEVVGVSHFNIDRLKVLVDARPELARATWDWGFADWETAIGAASHVGRKDIVAYLIEKGARPDIFTFAMLGRYELVKSMIDLFPGIQRTAGPHGISLLQHVKNGMAGDKETEGSKRLLDYLETLGDADGSSYKPLGEADSQKYLGDYRYGDKEGEGFSVRLNMRKFISLGKLGKNGGSLYKVAENKFIYNGFPSVSVTFQEENAQVISMVVTEPDLSLVARKV